MPKEIERGTLRKVMDKAGWGGSLLFGLPLSIATTIGAAATGAWWAAAGGLAWAKVEYTQIVEHHKKPEEQSWYNPERIMDKIIGSLRFKQQPSTYMAMAAA